MRHATHHSELHGFEWASLVHTAFILHVYLHAHSDYSAANAQESKRILNFLSLWLCAFLRHLLKSTRKKDTESCLHNFFHCGQT